jgi:site-specific recombinase XerD
MEKTITSQPVWDLLSDRWHNTLRAKGLSPYTMRDYLFTARAWSEWLAKNNYDIDATEVRDYHIEEFLGDTIAATSRNNAIHHYRNLSVYWKWLCKREKIPLADNPMVALEKPKAESKLTLVLEDDEFNRVLATCEGKGLVALRDRAILLLFRESGARVAELARIGKDDVDLAKRRIKVMGKGSKERWIAFGPDAGLALARYMKIRLRQPMADSPALWLNRRGSALAINTVKHMLNRRGRQAEISGTLHAHRLRHTWAHEWKLNGGSNEGMMALGGWSSERMAHHYGQSAQMTRALAEQQRMRDSGVQRPDAA